jgi:hypothetical protein
VRLWSLKGEKLRGMRSDFQPSSIKDGQYAAQSLDDALTALCSGRITSTEGEGRKHYSQAHRPQRSSLLRRLRSLERIGSTSSRLAICFCGRHNASLVPRYSYKYCRVPRTPEPGLGRPVESAGHVLRDRQPRSYSAAMEHRSHCSAQDIRWPPQRRRCSFCHCVHVLKTDPGRSVSASTPIRCILPPARATGHLVCGMRRRAHASGPSLDTKATSPRWRSALMAST